MAADSTDTTVRSRVRIAGEEYVIKGTGTKEHIQRLATLVDQTMRDVQRANPKLVLHKVAILAAINLANELTALQEEHDALLTLLEEVRTPDK